MHQKYDNGLMENNSCFLIRDLRARRMFDMGASLASDVLVSVWGFCYFCGPEVSGWVKHSNTWQVVSSHVASACSASRIANWARIHHQV